MATFTIDLLTGKVYLFSGDFSGSGSTPTSGSTYPQVNVYADLPPAGTVTAQIYEVRGGSGSYVLNRKPSGFYFSTGTVWRFLGDTPDFFKSDNFQIYDSIDTSKGITFITSGISTSILRKLTVQNSDGTIAYLTDLNTKVDLSVFADFTGNTLPNTYFKLDQSIPQIVSGDAPQFDAVQFNLTGVTTPAEGKLRWNVDESVLEYGLPGGNVNIQLGQEIVIRATNSSGTGLTNGQLVYVNGVQGNRPTIRLARADDNYAHNQLLMLTEDIGNNQSGYVTTFGIIHNLNTAAHSGGTVLYLSLTAGTYTTILPEAPAYAKRVGIVLRQHPTVGEILFNSSPVYKLTDLSDVDGTPLTVSGQIPIWNNTNQYFDFTGNINDYLPISSFNSYSANTFSLIQGKQDTLTEGTGISIVGNVISVTGTTSNNSLQLIDSVGGVNVNNVTGTTIAWTQEFSGTSLNFSGGSRIYIQATGLYEISYVLNVNNDTSSAKNIGTVVRKNGNEDITPMSTSSFSFNTANDISTNVMPSYLVLLSSSNYVELIAFRIGTAGDAFTKKNSSWFKIKKL